MENTSNCSMIYNEDSSMTTVENKNKFQSTNNEVNFANTSNCSAINKDDSCTTIGQNKCEIQKTKQTEKTTKSGTKKSNNKEEDDVRKMLLAYNKKIKRLLNNVENERSESTLVLKDLSNNFN